MKTKRLVLRKWTEADAESLYEYAKDPEVFATMSSGKFKKGQALSKKAVFHSACPFLIHVFCLALFETQNYNILDGGAKWII